MNAFKLIKNPDGKGYRLFVNGIDVSVGTTEIELHLLLRAGELPEVNLGMYGDIEIPEELEALITVERKDIDKIVEKLSKVEDPFEDDDFGGEFCVYCYNDCLDGHKPDCIWVAARELFGLPIKRDVDSSTV